MPRITKTAEQKREAKSAAQRARRIAKRLAEMPDAVKKPSAPKKGLPVLSKMLGEMITDGPATAAKRDRKRTAPKGERDPRLPEAGTKISVERKGKTYEAVERADGSFEYQGKPFKSLSAIASEILGCSANGFLFFRLIPGTQRAPRAAKPAGAPKGKKAKSAKSPAADPITVKGNDLATPAGAREALRQAGLLSA